MPNPNHCIECDKPAVIIKDSVYYCSSCALEEIENQRKENKNG